MIGVVDVEKRPIILRGGGGGESRLRITIVPASMLRAYAHHAQLPEEGTASASMTCDIAENISNLGILGRAAGHVSK